MTEISRTLQKGEELFLHFIEEIQKNKISDVSIRRALKKYDVKNLKINNVTPLRAKKMYSSIVPKYQSGVMTDKSWLENERRLFIWCTVCYLYKNSLEINEMKDEDFSFLNNMFPLKEMDLVKFQIYSLVKKDNKNCSWSAEEDELLCNLIQKQSTSNIEWSNISKEFFSVSGQKYFRNAKQCRQRWLNHLDPSKMKGKWQPCQDRILLQEVLVRGKKWSKIVQALKGQKNEHMIKNRYKSLIHKKEKVLRSKKIKQNDIIKMILKEYEQNMEKINGDDNEDDAPEEESIKEEGQNSQEQQSSQAGGSEDQASEEPAQAASSLQGKTCKLPIIIEHKPNRTIEREEQADRIDDQYKEKNEDGNQIEVCGTKADKEFVNSLFFNVNTPAAEDNRLHSIVLETRSPAGNLFLSPFPAGCWTPTLFLLEDTQGQGTPPIYDNFSATMKNSFSQFLGEQNDKKS